MPRKNYRKDEFLNNDVLVCGLLFLRILINKASILNLPYHWDESAYIGPTHWLAQGSLLEVIPGFHSPYIFLGHPPALYLSLATLCKIFGGTIWISHLFAIVFSFLGVYFTLYDYINGVCWSLYIKINLT